MNKLISSELWTEINRLAKKSKVKLVAVAYVTSDNIIRFKEGDLFIVDASDQAIRSGQTSAPLLKRAFEGGVDLYSCPNLHAKVMLLDGVAVVGSANISQSSERSLIEVALLTDNPAVVSATRNFLQKLQDHSTLIDQSFIRRISSLEVVRSAGRRFYLSKKPRLKIKLNTPRTWLVSVTWMDEGRYEKEIPYAEKGAEEAEKLLNKPSSEVGWIRFTKDRSRFVKEAKAGDSVIQISSKSMKSRKPDTVYFHTPILLRQKEPNCTRFFFEHPTNAERTTLTWGQFTKLAKRIGLPFKVGRHTTRLLPEEYSEALVALWKESKKRK